MNKILICFSLSLISLSFGFTQEKKDIEYIRKFAKIAVQEMELFKIPASIKLAQGLLETADGQSRLAQLANNHFGIKCKEEWKGERIYHNDDAPGECFRKYPSAWDSYRDHSLFLTTRKHYAHLFQLDITDYEGWAYGLKKSGYATNPRYPQILISRIEKYKLYEFDKISSDKVDELLTSLYSNYSNDETKQELALVTSKSTGVSFASTDIPVKLKTETVENAAEEKPEINTNPKERILRHQNQGLKYVVVQSGEDLAFISKWTGIPLMNLRLYNDLSVTDKIREGQFIFLEPKANKGVEEFYKVKPNDTPHGISQTLGIKLEELLKKNNLSYNDPLQENEILYLKRNKPSRS